MCRISLVTFLALALALVVACSASPAPTQATATTAGATCTTKSDCAEDLECVFSMPGCEGARGACTRVERLRAAPQTPSFPACSTLPGGRILCMCDGKELPTSCPAFAPFRREGSCPAP